MFVLQQKSFFPEQQGALLPTSGDMTRYHAAPISALSPSHQTLIRICQREVTFKQTLDTVSQLEVLTKQRICVTSVKIH